MGMTDFLNLPKSKPGSSGELGASLLAGKIRRSEKQAESKDSFGKWMTGAKALAKGTKWWLNEDVDNFHRGNSTLYANLDGLILSNQQVLADQQAITASKLSAKDFYAQKYYDKWVSDAVTLGKLPKYNILKSEANKIGIESAERQEKLYEAAKKMPTTIQEYKDAAVDYYDKPENVFEKGLEKGRQLFGKMNPEVMKLREGKLTMQKLADFEDDGMFDAAMAFKTALETKPPDYLSAVASIIDDLPYAIDKSDIHHEVATDNRRTIPDPANPDGDPIPNPNYNEKVVTSIVTLIDKAGNISKGDVSKTPLSELDITQLISDNYQKAVMDELNPYGQAFINAELIKLDPAYDAKTATGGTLKGALDYLKEIQDDNAYKSIVDKALANPAYRVYEEGETDATQLMLKEALKGWNDLREGINWDWNVAKDRAEAAKMFKQLLSGNRLMGKLFTGKWGDEDVTMNELDTRIAEMDEQAIIEHIMNLQAFGDKATIELSNPFTD
jgi:hypothetical protein